MAALRNYLGPPQQMLTQPEIRPNLAGGGLNWVKAQAPGSKPVPVCSRSNGLDAHEVSGAGAR